MSFDISCHLTFHVIRHFIGSNSNLSHYSNHSHQSHLGINADDALILLMREATYAADVLMH